MTSLATPWPSKTQVVPVLLYSDMPCSKAASRCAPENPGAQRIKVCSTSGTKLFSQKMPLGCPDASLSMTTSSLGERVSGPMPASFKAKLFATHAKGTEFDQYPQIGRMNTGCFGLTRSRSNRVGSKCETSLENSGG